MLRAGPVLALFTEGDLRQVCVGRTELARRIYVAIRDLNWNTLPGDISDLDIVDHGDSFAVRFTRRHKAGDLDYEWHAEIDGDPAGTIRYRMRGTSLSAFPYAKIGICVHHPVDGYAGQPFRGSTPDGRVSGTLPAAIGPQIHLDDGTDLPLFEPVSELDLTHTSGGVVTFEFAGDLWEMEDQRNWTDASYKSASTPAKLGYHHEAGLGRQFDQQVTIRAAGFPADSSASRADGALRIAVGAGSGPVFPPIGLRCADPVAALSDRARAVLRAIGPAHLRVDVHLASGSAAPDLAAAAHRARDLNCGLELAVFLPAADDAAGVDAALGTLRAGLAAAWPLLTRVLAFSEAEESSSAETVTAVRAALAQAGEAGVPVIAGTNIYFNELNRYRIPPGPADGLAWSVNPQIHAFDDLSLMENLQAQPDTLATARCFAPGSGRYVTPITLRPRFNAVAVTDEEFGDGELPWQVDVRQPSLFGAAWTLGSVAALATADGLTYYDTVGPAGVVESPDGSPSPATFFSRPDTPYPLAVVLADACGLGGGRVRAVSGADPAQVAVVAVSTAAAGTVAAAAVAAGTVAASTGALAAAGVVTVLLANLTAATRDVRVSVAGAAPGPARLRVLDEHTFELAAAGFEDFLTTGTDVRSTEGAVTVTLNPYAVARLDVTDG